MSYIFHLIFYKPLYNLLILMIWALPWLDVGVLVVLFTILVKVILFPVSQKAARTQVMMKELQVEMDEIKKKYQGNKQEEAVQTMALYKRKGVNPFSSILLVLIQLPIIFALYYIFFKGGLPNLDHNYLYSYIPTPEHIKMTFLGFLDITKPNLILAILTAVSQYVQISITMPPAKKKDDKPAGERSFGDELSRSMSFQMKYILPIFIFIGAMNLPAVVSIYWVTSNLFAIGQELYIRKNLNKEKENIK
ncbi:MAG: YidC/Oxa1 family membrane protein insertase [bacterium]